jgi:glycosyltransferase involved in cell wall biosynthesis
VTKVSIIVPTYCSGEGLDRVVASLDAQTMPASDFEMVFVDDGSPDDTFARLEKLAAARSNVTVTAIPNSGWPSRPRNVGLDLAAGDYVVFMDHDDELYPDALRAAYDLAAEQGADVVSAREIRTNEWFAYWTSFERDVRVDERTRPQHLAPWTTHKLFRRQFLLDHGIRFREGSRMLWEDVMVDIDIYAATDKIAVLASVPFYKWVLRRGENTSLTYGHDLDAFVDSIAMMYDHLDESGVDDEFTTFMKAHQYGLRILSYLAGPRGLRREPEDRARSLDLAHDFVRTRVPEELDALVSKADLARAELVRADRQDLVVALAEHDDGIRALPVATAISGAEAGGLTFDLQASWTRGRDDAAAPLLLRRRDGRLMRVLDDGLVGALSPRALDVTNEVEETQVHLVLTDRASSVGWRQPVDHRLVLDPAGTDDLVGVSVRGAPTVDVDRAALGAALADGSWAATLRVAFMGFVSHLPVRYDGPDRVTVAGGRVVMASASKRGRLTLEIGAPLRSLLQATKPLAAQAEVRRVGLRGAEVSVPVRGAAASEDSRLPVQVRLRPVGDGADVELPGCIEGSEEGLRLVVRVADGLGPGRHRMLIDVPSSDGTRTVHWWVPVVLGHGRLGSVTAERVPVKGKRKKVWGRATSKKTAKRRKHR